MRVREAEITQEEEIEAEEEAGAVVDEATILGVVEEEAQQIHTRVEAQQAHTGTHNQVVAEEKNVDSSNPPGA
jgi:hypothetical protein